MSRTITRASAKAANLKRYFTNKPCLQGHVAYRQTSNGVCSECHNATQRKRKKQNVVAVMKHQRLYPEKRRAAWWVKRGATPPTRPRPQHCECCGNIPTGKTKIIFFDHCHKKKHFRGWLCRECNLGLGMFKDSIERLQRAIKYLRKHG